ncbi:MAG: hypothetical protein ACFHU9_12465 [Fluviicola sp.]
MNPKITKLIDQYLSGTLEGEDKLNFERELAESQMLQREVELQRSIMNAAARASQRQEVQEAARRYRRKNLLRNGGISALIAIAITSTVLFLSRSDQKTQNDSVQEMSPITAETRDKLDQNQSFENIPIQYFQIPKQGVVHLSEQGVLISVPEAAFLKNGKPYHGNVILQYQEAIRGVDIIKSGLSTMTGDELLETLGMFSVTGYTEEGEALQFNPKVGVYLQAPVAEYEPGMQLYDGEKLEDGSIDWVTPEPLNKIPTLANMSDLDFYPAGYEDELDRLKWKRDKQSRDSLYLSLEHTMDLKTIREEASNATEPLELPEEEVVTIEKEMGAVYGDKPNKRLPVKGIDESISWTFSRERIESDVWIIKAVANIAEGYHIYSMDEEDAFSKTQLKIIDTKNLIVLEEPMCSSPVRTIRMNSQTVKGYTGEVTIQAKVQLKTRRYIRVPVRAVFKLASKDMEYARVMRGGDINLWETPEERLSRYEDLANLEMNGSYILPSNVMAFWKSAFNNTILSTREFERRMQVIHSTCDNEVLELYTHNLNEPLSNIDRKVVRMGYLEFQEFANENVGALELSNPHVALLSAFYDKATDMLRKDAKTKVSSEEERLKQWNTIVDEQSKKDRQRAQNRNLQYSNNLRNFTRSNLAKQFGKMQGFTITQGSNGRATAIKNIDALRPYAGFPMADLRKKMEEATQKTTAVTKIKYNDFKVRVANFQKYTSVYLYLYADEINSYQRINLDSTGTVECRLQNDISYAIGIVGITPEGFSYYEHDFLKEGNLGKVKLKAVSEKELDARIEKMNTERLSGNNTLAVEMNWLRTARKNYKVQRQYKEMIAFRRDLQSLIFPCVSFDKKNPWRADAETNALNSQEIVVDESL